MTSVNYNNRWYWWHLCYMVHKYLPQFKFLFSGEFFVLIVALTVKKMFAQRVHLRNLTFFFINTALSNGLLFVTQWLLFLIDKFTITHTGWINTIFYFTKCFSVYNTSWVTTWRRSRQLFCFLSNIHCQEQLKVTSATKR